MPASRVLYVPEAQGGLPPSGTHCTYWLRVPATGSTARAAHRGDTKVGWLSPQAQLGRPMEAVSAYARASRLAPRWVAEAVDPAPIAQVA